MLSATLTAGTSRLIDLAMVDPVTIEIDAEEPEYVSQGWSAEGGAAAAAAAGGGGKDDAKKKKISGGDDGDAMEAAAAAMAGGKTEAELATADVKQMVMRMPEQLRHTAVEVPVKARLAVLAGLLAGWMQGAVPKVMVFFSSCESVEFHYRVLSWLAAGGKSRQSSASGKGSAGGGGLDVDGGGLGGGGYAVFRLHGEARPLPRSFVRSFIYSRLFDHRVAGTQPRSSIHSLVRLFVRLFAAREI